MSTSLFPDVNVWVALSHPIHPQHHAALSWIRSVDPATPLLFCRFTQIGLLRLLSTRAAMGGDVMTQKQAWAVFDAFFSNPSVALLMEPEELTEPFRAKTNSDQSSPKQWADGYLLAFAQAAGIRLVTFDRALAKTDKQSVLLL